MVGKLRREMKTINFFAKLRERDLVVWNLKRRGELIMGRVIEELKGITPVRFYGEDIA
jgi:hypothetical protein